MLGGSGSRVDAELIALEQLAETVAVDEAIGGAPSWVASFFPAAVNDPVVITWCPAGSSALRVSAAGYVEMFPSILSTAPGCTRSHKRGGRSIGGSRHEP